MQAGSRSKENTESQCHETERSEARILRHTIQALIISATGSRTKARPTSDRQAGAGTREGKEPGEQQHSPAREQGEQAEGTHTAAEEEGRQEAAEAGRQAAAEEGRQG